MFFYYKFITPCFYVLKFGPAQHRVMSMHKRNRGGPTLTLVDPESAFLLLLIKREFEPNQRSNQKKKKNSDVSVVVVDL